ncbi:MAG TPA: hypothetical protein VFX13_08355 [Gaiellales bacterium]|nr:hypothetical protein [Gaiellales bacterium]
MKTKTRSEGRFESAYTTIALRAAIREIAETAAPDDPLECRQRAFDAARASAGHPHAPSARACCQRLGRRGSAIPWEDLLQSVFDQDDLQVEARRGGKAAEPHLDSAHLYFALRWAARELNVEILAPDRYDEYRGSVLGRAMRGEQQAQELLELLPTVGQIQRIAAGAKKDGAVAVELADWDAALVLAELNPRPDRSHPVAPQSGMPLAKAIYWWVKCSGSPYRPRMEDVRWFAEMADVRLEGGKDRFWIGHLDKAAELLEADGLTLGEELVPPGTHVRLHIPDWGIPGAVPRVAAPGGWPRKACLRSMRVFIASRQAGQKRTQKQYVVWASGHPDRPSAQVFAKYGGFEKLRAEAEQLNRDEGIPTIVVDAAVDDGRTNDVVDAAEDIVDADASASTVDGGEASTTASSAAGGRVVVRKDTRTIRSAAAVRQLIDRGVLHAGERLYRQGRDALHEAILTEDGYAQLPDQPKPMTLSQAANACGSTLSGWWFWKVERDGKEVPLYKIRHEGASEGEGA